MFSALKQFFLKVVKNPTVVLHLTKTEVRRDDVFRDFHLSKHKLGHKIKVDHQNRVVQMVDDNEHHLFRHVGRLETFAGLEIHRVLVEDSRITRVPPEILSRVRKAR